MSTLLIETQSFYDSHSREANRQYYDPADLGDHDLLDYLLESLKEGTLARDETSRRHARVVRGERRGNRAYLFHTHAGRAGFNGEVADFETGESILAVTPNQVTALEGRTLVIVPPLGTQSLIFYERIPGVVPGLQCVRQARKIWRERLSGLTWHFEWIQFDEAFLAEADMKAFEVRKKGVRTDGPLGVVVGDASHRIAAARGKRFGQDWIQKFLKHPASAREYFALEGSDDYQTVLELSANGVTKTYVVEEDNRPRLQIDLPLGMTDDKFVKECIGHAANILAVDWKSNWCS